MNILASIILGTNRPDNIRGFVKNIEEKSKFPQQVEIIFSIDEGDQKCISVLQELQKSSQVKIKYLESVRQIGYFEANIHYNECLHLADPSSYFFAIFSDKLELETQDWDEKLKKYVGYFPDDYFRVRISHFKHLRYNYDLRDALTRPDNFAFHSRKFLELSGGWGDTWGPDTWVQGIVFFSELLGIKDRDIVAPEINLKQYHYSDSRGVNRASRIRNMMGHWSFIYLSSKDLPLQNYLRLALKTKIYLDNYQVLKMRKKIRFSYDNNFITVFDENDQVLFSQPISQASHYLVDRFIKLEKSEGIVENNGLSQIIRKRIEKRKRTKNKLKKFIISLNIAQAKFRVANGVALKKISSRISPPDDNIDFGRAVKVQSKSDQFTIEVNSLVEKAVRDQYDNSVIEVEKLYPPKLIETAKKHHVTNEMLSYLDHGHVVEILRKQANENESALDDSVVARFYANIGLYLMNSGLQDFAAEMFKLSLEKKYTDDTASIALQNLMYTSVEKYSEEKIYHATREMMQQMTAKNRLPEYRDYANELTSKRVLNIGYTCHFFDNETSSNLLLPILKAHNRDRVKIFIYSDQDPKITKKETMALADVWRDTYKIGDVEFCEMVRNDKIDVLFELNGFCVQNRYCALNARPAPVQVSFYNLSATTGLDSIDYMISCDDIKLDQRFYSEKIINKKGVYLTISPEIPRISPIAPFTKNGYITFGSFGQIHKITRESVLMWAEVLKRVPDSKFFFKSNNLHRKEIVSVFKKHFEDGGIEFEARVIIEGVSPYNELIKSYEKIDIALDTFPYAGGTTTSEALLCGTPVMHLTGERFCSQHGDNYLRYCGVEELICQTKEEFIEKSVALANDREKIQWYKNNLPDLVRNSKKCDIAGYTKELEDVCFEMWNEYLKSPTNS